jgi:hypothetical protein
MSTSYYHFIHPVTSVKINEGPVHDRVTVFESHAQTGTLTVSKGMGKKFASFFAEEVDDNLAPMRTHFGGKGRGCVVTIHDEHLHPDTYLIDEYGSVFTVAEIKAMDGRGA